MDVISSISFRLSQVLSIKKPAVSTLHLAACIVHIDGRRHNRCQGLLLSAD